MTQTKPIGTWHRPVSESMKNPVFFADPSRSIADAITKGTRGEILAAEQDHREANLIFFSRVHRIGLMRGLGFNVPQDETRDGINMVRIVAEIDRKGTWHGLCTMEFCHSFINSEGNDNTSPPEIQIIRKVTGVALEAVVSTYHQEAGPVLMSVAAK